MTSTAPSPAAQHTVERLTRRGQPIEVRDAVEAKRMALHQIEEAARDFEGPAPAHLLAWYSDAFDAAPKTPDAATLFDAFAIEAGLIVDDVRSQDADFQEIERSAKALADWLPGAGASSNDALQQVRQAFAGGAEIRVSRTTRARGLVQIPAVVPEELRGQNLAPLGNAITQRIEEAFQSQPALAGLTPVNLIVDWKS